MQVEDKLFFILAKQHANMRRSQIVNLDLNRRRSCPDVTLCIHFVNACMQGFIFNKTADITHQGENFSVVLILMNKGIVCFIDATVDTNRKGT